MKVIDSRSGIELQVGQTVRYPGGEWLRLDGYQAGFFQGRATITSTLLEPTSGRLVTATQIVPLVVRWTHPGFFLQHVAFIPS